jgi:nitroreductase
MFNDLTSPATLLATRRSGKARDMVAPFPTDAQLDAMIAVAARVPDHGKLAPWRFVIIPPTGRDAFAALLTSAYRRERPTAGRLELEAMETFARHPAALVALLSTPAASSKIPVWEQHLSCGAAAMQLLNAATAMGFVGNWLTGWPAQNDEVLAALLGDNHAAAARIAGFFFIGSPAKPLEERPRPDLPTIIRRWPA